MYHIGVDIGGTFTDTVVMDPAGEVRVYKTPTTPGDLAAGVMTSLDLAAEDMQMSVESLLQQTARFGHGTTQPTNAFIERKGARTALITTRGFGDTILIQRTMGQWADLGDDVGRYTAHAVADPIVPKSRIIEVSERVDFAGDVVVDLNMDDVAKAIDQLEAQKVEAVAVCLLWSFKNPRHEQVIREEILKRMPNVFVSISSEVAPVIREYERTAATAINCYLGPVVSRYVLGLERTLKNRGLKGPMMIMDSAGGVMPASQAASHAVSLLTSGPSGGVLASMQLAKTLGYDNIITTDMGGTSFDVSLIINQEPIISSTSRVEKYHISIPMLNITAIGSGGGSIAHVKSGYLFVGPQSAGAVPGPVCYDKGGTEPTVTDADLVLGYLDPDYFLGGRIKLNKATARERIKQQIADPLGLSVEEAAAGIRFVVDNKMSDLLRTLTIEKGYDPREFALFAYGGAGPTHCCTYGSELNVQEIVVPVTATAHSAYGALSCDLHRAYELSDLMRTPANFKKASDHLEVDRCNRNFEALEQQGHEFLEEASEGGVLGDRAGMNFRRYVDVRYRRQVHELLIPVPAGPLSAESIDAIVAAFEEKYEELYGKGAAYREAGVEFTTFRVDANLGLKNPDPKRYPVPADASLEDAAVGERRVYSIESRDFSMVRIFNGSKLYPGASVEGPAIIEHPGTTIVIGAGQVGVIDEYLNTVIRTVGGGEAR
jgi:N-methylhydantoinase A